MVQQLSLTGFITDAAWKDDFIVWFIVVGETCVTLETHFGAWRQRRPSADYHSNPPTLSRRVRALISKRMD